MSSYQCAIILKLSAYKLLLVKLPCLWGFGWYLVVFGFGGLNVCWLKGRIICWHSWDSQSKHFRDRWHQNRARRWEVYKLGLGIVTLLVQSPHKFIIPSRRLLYWVLTRSSSLLKNALAVVGFLRSRSSASDSTINAKASSINWSGWLAMGWFGRSFGRTWIRLPSFLWVALILFFLLDTWFDRLKIWGQGSSGPRPWKRRSILVFGVNSKKSPYLKCTCRCNSAESWLPMLT